MWRGVNATLVAKRKQPEEEEPTKAARVAQIWKVPRTGRFVLETLHVKLAMKSGALGQNKKRRLRSGLAESMPSALTTKSKSGI